VGRSEVRSDAFYAERVTPARERAFAATTEAEREKALAAFEAVKVEAKPFDEALRGALKAYRDALDEFTREKNAVEDAEIEASRKAANRGDRTKPPPSSARAFVEALGTCERFGGLLLDLKHLPRTRELYSKQDLDLVKARVEKVRPLLSYGSDPILAPLFAEEPKRVESKRAKR
jgi:hypothetical protein